MLQPLQITFHGMAHSDPVETYVRKRAEKLETFCDRIQSGRVAVETPHRHKRHGRPHRVSIDLVVPGGEIVVDGDVGSPAGEDLYATIDAAFDEAQRRLEDHVRVIRNEVKHHEDAARHGTVEKLFSYEGYGFLRTEEGDEIYFHKNSVLNGAFDRMQIGARVRFNEATGDDGIHASTVALVRNPVKRSAPS